MVAWEAQQAGIRTDPSTSIRLSISAAGVRFGRSRVVESFQDPSGEAPASGSLRLLRLSTENVVMAWSGLSSGNYVVYAAPVSLTDGVFNPTIVSRPDQESMLSDLVGGPHGEALALWSSSPASAEGVADLHDHQILAAMGRYASQGMIFDPVESVASAGPNGPVVAAIDPGDGRALAAWVLSTEHPKVAYAVRAPDSSALVSRVSGEPGFLRFVLVVTEPASGLDASW
jgi:hypothetical protein